MTTFPNSGFYYVAGTGVRWQNFPSVITPLSANNVQNLEDRLTNYVDLRVPQSAITGQLAYSNSAGDLQWAARAGTDYSAFYLQRTNNLSDLTNVTNARGNLGVAYNTNPAIIKADGVASLGSSGLVADAAHVHPAAVATPIGSVASTYLTPSGGDDSAAMVTALANYGSFPRPVISLSAGTFLWNSTIPKLARNVGAVIYGQGKGVTTVKLSSSASAFLSVNKIADYDIFGWLDLHDLTVDANHITSTTHILFGNYVGGGINRLSWTNINIWNVDVINGTTTNQNGVIMLAMSTTGGETQQLFATDIYIDNCRFYGGRIGYNVINNGTTLNSVLPVIDRLYITRCHHDTLVTPSTAPSGSWGNYDIGGQAQMGRVVIRDCTGVGSNDVGIEIDGGGDLLVDGCSMYESFNSPFYHSVFNSMFASATTPTEYRLTFRDCYSYNSRVAPDIGCYGVQSRASSTQAHQGMPDGTIVYDNCKAVIDGPTYASAFTSDGFKLGDYDTQAVSGCMPIRKVVYRNCEFIIDNITYTSTNAGAPAAINGWELSMMSTGSSYLSSALTSTPITNIPVYALLDSIPAGGLQMTSYQGSGLWKSQQWVTTGATPGATQIPVTAQSPYFSFASNTTVVHSIKALPIVEFQGANLFRLNATQTNVSPITTRGIRLFHANCIVAGGAGELHVDYNLPGQTINNTFLIAAGDAPGSNVWGELPRLRVHNFFGDTSPQPLSIPAPGTVTIGPSLLKARDWDISNVPGTKVNNVIGGNTSFVWCQNWVLQTMPAAGATLSVTGSPQTFTNTTTFPQMLGIYGGTVSSITLNATQIAGATGITFPWYPGDVVIITYTVAPTVQRQPLR